MSLFDPHTFGPGPGDRVIERPRPRRPGELRQIWRWVRVHELPAQVVLMLGAVAIASVVFVFGLLVGAGIAPMVSGWRATLTIFNATTPARWDSLPRSERTSSTYDSDCPAPRGFFLHGAKVPRSGLNPIDKHVGGRVRMRRLMLEMSQTRLADGLGLTFQQVQKYEKGANRIGASRLQQISQILQVPVPFFFDGAPGHAGAAVEIADSDSYVNDFLATSDGLAFVKAYMRLPNPKMRRAIVHLVEQITPEDD